MGNPASFVTAASVEDTNTFTAAQTFSGSVGVGGAPDSKAALTVTSTTQGFLPPRMTGTQRDAIASPPAGLVVYNTTTNKLNVYTGSAWEAVTSA